MHSVLAVVTLIQWVAGGRLGKRQAAQQQIRWGAQIWEQKAELAWEGEMC